jgi:TolB-like protein
VRALTSGPGVPNLPTPLAAILAVLLPAVALAAPDARPAKRPRVAVMEIKVISGGDPQLEALLSEVALTEAASFRGLDTIGRSDITSLLGFERERQLLGCSQDTSCLAELGGALGVDYLLIGSVGRVGTLLRLDLKLVEARRARVLGRSGVSLQDKAELLVEATQNGVRALLRQLTPEAPLARPSGLAGPSRWPAWVTLGVGGAALAAGLTAGVMAKTEYDQLKRSRTDLDYADTYASRSSRIRRLSVASDVLVPVGLVGVGVGGWLWWRSRPPPVTVRVSATPGGAGLILAGEF